MLYNALRGTVQVQVTGGWPERFLSSCAAESIRLWVLSDEIHQDLE